MLRVNLIDATTREHVSINQALISQGHAELAEEPILSQVECSSYNCIAFLTLRRRWLMMTPREQLPRSQVSVVP